MHVWSHHLKTKGYKLHNSVIFGSPNIELRIQLAQLSTFHICPSLHWFKPSPGEHHTIANIPMQQSLTKTSVQQEKPQNRRPNGPHAKQKSSYSKLSYFKVEVLMAIA
jgi:hypothetical protein